MAFAAGVGVAVGYVAWRRKRYPSGNRSVPEPKSQVELERYLGRWYELGRYHNRFERGCEGVTAEYAMRSDGLIDVVNTCREGAPDGPQRTSRGRARVVPGSGNAKLEVSFFGPFFIGDYWVLDRDDDYRWSIVGEPSGRYLWILSRESNPPEGEYEALLMRARTLGYDMSRFRRTRQPPV